MPCVRSLPRYLIREATIADVYALARTLRERDRAECACYGVTPAAGLRASFRAATIRRCAVIEGEIAAMWGAAGVALGYSAHAWLMTAPVIEKLPVAFIREARREVALMLQTHQRLEGEVAVDYPQAIRLLEVLGFTIGGEFKMPGGRFRSFCLERT